MLLEFEIDNDKVYIKNFGVEIPNKNIFGTNHKGLNSKFFSS